jgi:hypothetical protein
MAQIVDDGATGGLRQGQEIDAVALSTDVDQALSPVDVVQPQSRHLDRA